MRSVYRFYFAVIVCAVVLTGCATFEQTRTPGDFVKTTLFSPLATFSYQATLMAGLAEREDREEVLLRFSNQVLEEELVARGFEAVAPGESDFYVVTSWRKAISANSGIFDSVDGASASMVRGNVGSATAMRYTLIVEVYHTQGGELFWRAELPNVFDAIQFTDERVQQSLSQAIQNFPKKVYQDPNLPNIM